VAEIRGFFGSVGGLCVCVWIEIVVATVFCSAKAQFWMIPEAILIPKMYARLQKIASNFFKNFVGEAPQIPRRRSVRGFAPLPGPPFQNFWIRPCFWSQDGHSNHYSTAPFTYPYLPLHSQPKLVLIYQPRRDGRLSWPGHHHGEYSLPRTATWLTAITVICSDRHASPGSRLRASNPQALGPKAATLTTTPPCYPNTLPGTGHF